ncbi:MAG TPA: hypothetical protein VGO47_05220 [Chlamydiales bacterium]|nr:hypothetical protein [Chlamydiales bacterium]
MENEVPFAALEIFGIHLPERDTLKWREMLEERIDHLLQNDFDRLISLLYRLDVDEMLLKTKIKESEGLNTAGIITDLVIERQLKRMQSREQFRRKDEDIDENEKW